MSENTVSHHHAHHHDTESTIVYGFWLYIMSDCILFATLFAAYIVLQGNTFGGPGPKELFSMPLVLVETFILLTSSFTYGIALLSAFKRHMKTVMIFLGLTFILGLSFVAIEITEFTHFYLEGHTWQKSAFLSAYFTLVGTHGLHVTIGLIWMAALMIQLRRHGLIRMTQRKLTALGLFWHFLDIVWIFIFTIVYLMGVI